MSIGNSQSQFPDHKFYNYLAQLLKMDPHKALIIFTLSSDDLSQFLQYINQHHPDFNRQPLLNHYSCLGLLPCVRLVFNDETRSLDPYNQPNLTQATILATLHGHFHVIKYFLNQNHSSINADLYRSLVFVAYHSNQWNLADQLLQAIPTTNIIVPTFEEACRQGLLFLVERILNYNYYVHQTTPACLSAGYLLAHQGGHYHVTRYLEKKTIEQYYQDPTNTLYTPQTQALTLGHHYNHNDLLKAMALSPNSQTQLQKTIQENAQPDYESTYFNQLLSTFGIMMLMYFVFLMSVQIIIIEFQSYLTIPSSTSSPIPGSH